MFVNAPQFLCAAGLICITTFSAQAYASPLTFAQAYGSALAAPSSDQFPWNNVFSSGIQSASINVAPKTGMSSFGTASANMASGTLHVSSYADTVDSNVLSVSVLASARLMDKFVFSTQTGDPYIFQNSDSVTFHVDVDGTSYFEELNASFGATTQIQLTFAWWGIGKVIGNASESASIQSYTSLCSIQTNEHNTSLSQGGAGGPNCNGEFSVTNSQNAVPFLFSNSFDFTFNPMGDFDWAIELTATTSASEVDGVSYRASMDVSQTAKILFAGPDDALTTAASGIFPFSQISNTIPEPSTLALIGSIFACFATLRATATVGRIRRIGTGQKSDARTALPDPEKRPGQPSRVRIHAHALAERLHSTQVLSAYEY